MINDEIGQKDSLMKDYEIKLSGSALSQLMAAILQKGASFRFCARGGSMSPFIRNNDIITISPPSSDKRKVGDIVAVVNSHNGFLVVHRVVKLSNNNFLVKGDNCQTTDGTFSQVEIRGVVTKVERNSSQIQLGITFGHKIIAFLSRTGILNSLILPSLRKLKQTLSSTKQIHI